jgi:putative sterol carrier protein
MTPDRQATPDGWVTTLIGFAGRLAFEVDGKTLLALQVDDQRIDVIGGDGGEARAVAICMSEDDARKILNGELDAVVAALQGRLAIDGDLEFAIKVLRTLRAAPQAAASSPPGG